MEQVGGLKSENGWSVIPFIFDNGLLDYEKYLLLSCDTRVSKEADNIEYLLRVKRGRTQ